MDFGTTAVGIILIAICALPFVLMYINRKKKEIRRLSALRKIADGQGRPVSTYDICGDCIIGMDATPKHVYFLKNQQNGDVGQVVDLSEVAACKVVKLSRTVGKAATMSRIELAFTPVIKEQPETRFVFYNENQNAALSNELEIAEKWNKLLQEQLKRA